MGNQTAFAEAAQQPSNDTKDVNSGVTISAEAQSSLQSTKSYKLVKSATGNNLYVEVRNKLAHAFLLAVTVTIAVPIHDSG